MLKIDIFVPNHSMGLIVDSQVFQEALLAFNYEVRIFSIPLHFYLAPYDLSQLQPGGAHIAIFMEKILRHPQMMNYPRRVLSLHPEWLLHEEVSKFDLITEIWHKTHFSLQQVSPKFPDLKHFLMGFSTPDPGVRVTDYNFFIHLRGKSLFRNTQPIINSWARNPTWPPIKIQAYGDGTFIHFPRWVNFADNIHCFFGFMGGSDYLQCAASGGVHLCLSETEAFGHYINEARAMGALTVVLDAPPMNELIDANSGILIPVTHAMPCNFGMRYQTTEENIQIALEKLMSMTLDDRRALGNNARSRYEADKKTFFRQLETICLGK